MNIELLNVRIYIQKNEVISDAIGNRKNAWKDYYTCYATVSAEAGKESTDAGLVVDDSKIDLFITPFSSSNIRRFTILEASQLMSSSVSSAWIPTNTSIPLLIEENNCCSMVTLARVTR